MNHTAENPIRYSLGTLLLLMAINAFGGGYYGMAGANDVPVEWLHGSPFNSYFVPGLILFVVIGSTSLLAAIAVFKRHTLAKKAAFTSAIVVLIWLAVQLTIIGYVSWMQPVTTAAAVLILILTWKLPEYGY